jgi:hypothetical protein
MTTGQPGTPHIATRKKNILIIMSQSQRSWSWTRSQLFQIRDPKEEAQKSGPLNTTTISRNKAKRRRLVDDYLLCLESCTKKRAAWHGCPSHLQENPPPVLFFVANINCSSYGASDSNSASTESYMAAEISQSLLCSKCL